MMDKELKSLVEDKWNEAKGAVDTVKDDLTKEITKLEDALKTQGKQLSDALAVINSNQEKGDFDSEFLKFLTENKDELARVAKAGHGHVEFNYDFLADKGQVNKAVGDMSTGSGGDVAAAPVNHNTQLSRIRLRDDNPLIAMCNVISTNKASFAYTEPSPKEGGYAFVAEAGTKPQIDFKWDVRYAEPYKIAAYEVFSEEVVTDIPRIMSTARGFLKDKHDLFKADAIYFGDGLGNNPSGATTIGRVFAAGAMADKVSDSTIMDVINAIVTDIYTTHNFVDEVPYMPNLVLLNPVDFFINFQAAKDANKWPLYGGVQLFNSYQVGGMTIMPWSKIPAGKIFVGDMSKYNISNWVRYSVRIGWINDQFITNQFTMVGESRSHYFVKNFDTQAFVYDDIAVVQAAIDPDIV